MKLANVVGSGPNGLSAAIALARQGVRVRVFEGHTVAGGSLRTEAATLPGFRHDIGAAVFPMAVASPFLRSLPLARHGLDWIEPEIPLAHPLPNGDAVALFHSLEETANHLREDGEAYRDLMQNIVRAWHDLIYEVLGPIFHLPRHPFALAGFGLKAFQPATTLARSHFRTDRARTLFAGLAAHAVVPLDSLATSAVALVLGATAHTGGWPIARGGSQAVADALVGVLGSFRGTVETNHWVSSVDDLPPADCTLLDVTPQQFLQLAGESLPLDRRRPYVKFRRGPGICKIDWALSSPIPWQNDLCRRAGTIHLGGSEQEIVASEVDAFEGRDNDRPFVLLSQPSLFDPSRAPAGKHTAWAYCHVPNGSTRDMTPAIEAQVERFAPGFRDVILARNTRTAPQMEAWNPNLLGGDVSGGAMELSQLLRRPKLPPYSTPVPGVFLCSSSTPPAGGVHGMCGALAAEAAALHLGIPLPPLRPQR
ncbi:phytoene desaturase family protein [Terriglobus aquaticus]|uniref:Phytoene desaturase family protein n=1 Tax=Terriglobus aquaticus TaxID=940139 RepID=A0ABW9KJJ4_9BACT|nr:NAD(P)/FAD-dependent oxidoreductase [Terriglobus aquaticus]